MRMGLVNLGPTVVHSSATAAVPKNWRYIDGEVLRCARVSLASKLEIEWFTYKVFPLITAVLPLTISECTRLSKCPADTTEVRLGL